MSVVHKNIAKASAILIFANIIGYVLSFGKELLVAAKFGISNGMDAFYAAITIPNFITGILTSLFAAILIPVLSAYTDDDKDTAQSTINIVISYVLLATALLVICTLILSPLIVSLLFAGFDQSTQKLTAFLLRIISPILLFSCLVGICTSILYTRKKFAVPAFSTIFVTLSIIIGIMIFGKSLGVSVLIWSMLIGIVIQFAVLILALKKDGFTFAWSLDSSNPTIQSIKSLILPYLAVSSIYYLMLIVDRTMASMLDTGSVSALGYADKLVHMPLQVFGASFGISAYPFFASLASKGKIEDLKDTIASSINLASFVLIPITFYLIVFSRPIVKVLFERGAFSSADTTLTAIIFACFSVQLVFYTATSILSRVAMAQKFVKIVIILASFSFIANVLLNLLFIRLINPPVAGIALSTSIVYVLSTILMFFLLKAKMVNLHGLYILKASMKMILAAICSILLSRLIFFKLGYYLNDGAFISLLSSLVISISIGFALYVLFAYLMKVEEVIMVKYFINKIESKLNFLKGNQA